MFKLTVEIEGKTVEDLALAMEETTKKVQEGYASGANSNDDGSYYFKQEEMEE